MRFNDLKRAVDTLFAVCFPSNVVIGSMQSALNCSSSMNCAMQTKLLLLAVCIGGVGGIHVVRCTLWQIKPANCKDDCVHFEFGSCGALKKRAAHENGG